jgi:hypothetical protein
MSCQLVECGHTEVQMHQLRNIVRRSGRVAPSSGPLDRRACGAVPRQSRRARPGHLRCHRVGGSYSATAGAVRLRTSSEIVSAPQTVLSPPSRSRVTRTVARCALRGRAQFPQLRAGTQPGADRRRRGQPHLVAAVVGAHLQPVHPVDLVHQHRDERDRQVAGRDGGAERAGRRPLRVAVNRLVVAGGVGEQVDLLLDVELAFPLVVAGTARSTCRTWAISRSVIADSPGLASVGTAGAGRKGAPKVRDAVVNPRGARDVGSLAAATDGGEAAPSCPDGPPVPRSLGTPRSR